MNKSETEKLWPQPLSAKYSSEVCYRQDYKVTCLSGRERVNQMKTESASPARKKGQTNV